MSAEIRNLAAERITRQLAVSNIPPELQRHVLQAKVHMAQAALAVFDGTDTIARWHEQQASHHLDIVQRVLPPAAPMPDYRMTESLTAEWLRNLAPARKASALVPSCGTSEGGDAA